MLICVGSGCLKGRGGVGERLFSDAEGLVSPSCAQSPKASAASAGARLYSAPEYEGARSDGVVMGVGFGIEIRKKGGIFDHSDSRLGGRSLGK